MSGVAKNWLIAVGVGIAALAAFLFVPAPYVLIGVCLALVVWARLMMKDQL